MARGGSEEADGLGGRCFRPGGGGCGGIMGDGGGVAREILGYLQTIIHFIAAKTTLHCLDFLTSN